MRRTEVLQGIRLMRFEGILDRTRSRELSQGEAASVLGVSERTFRRWRDRFEADGAEGLYDRRLGKVSARRVPVDTVIEVLELFDTRYFDFTARHFWDKLVHRRVPQQKPTGARSPHSQIAALAREGLSAAEAIVEKEEQNADEEAVPRAKHQAAKRFRRRRGV